MRCYAFRREEKPEISPALFVHCLLDFWVKRKGAEKTLTLRDIAVGHGSPGQIFKLPEWDVRERIESIDEASGGELFYHESAAESQVRMRRESFDLIISDYLTMIYERKVTYA